MMRRSMWLATAAAIILAAGGGAAWMMSGARAQEREAAAAQEREEEAAQDREAASSGSGWEYLIVAGGNVAFPSTGSPGRRKQDEFSREATTVERNLDRLGAEGWELVSVGGPPNDPIFYLKRAKGR